MADPTGPPPPGRPPPHKRRRKKAQEGEVAGRKVQHGGAGRRHPIEPGAVMPDKAASAVLGGRVKRGREPSPERAAEGKRSRRALPAGDINQRDGEGLTALLRACDEIPPDVAYVQDLLRAGADPNLVDREKITPLMVACQNDFHDIASALIDGGAQLDTRGPEGWTALHWACRNGNTTSTRLLVSRSATVTVAGADRRTPLHLACQYGDVNAARLLLQNNATVDARAAGNLTPLHLASREGFNDVVEVLLRAEPKPNLDLEDQQGRSALYWACDAQDPEQEGYRNTIRALVAAGAKIDHAGRTDETPLYLASAEKDLSLVRLLLELGADANAPNSKGKTPLQAACKDGNAEIVEALLRAGAQQKTDDQGITFVHLAAEKGHAGVIRALAQAGVSVNPQDVNGATPLYLACRYGKTDVAVALLDNGADPHITENRDRWTPLHTACRNGHAEIAVALVKQGAFINALTQDGFTPLHLAAYCRDPSAVRALLQFKEIIKLDPEMHTVSGTMTPLLVACIRGNSATALALIEAGANAAGAAPVAALGTASARESPLLIPLVTASQKGLAEVVVALCRKGAPVDRTSANGRTALHHAALLGQAAVTIVLLHHGANRDLTDRNGNNAVTIALQMPLARPQGSPPAYWTQMMARYRDTIAVLIQRGAWPSGCLMPAGVTREHLLKPVAEAALPEEGPDVDLRNLLTMWDAIEFNDTKAPGTYNPRFLRYADRPSPQTPEEIAEYLAMLRGFLQNVVTHIEWGVQHPEPSEEDRQAPEGINPDTARSYAAAAGPLKHIVQALQQPEIDPDIRTATIVDLAIGAGFCPPGFKDAVNTQYRLVVAKQEEPSSVEQSVLRILLDFRKGVARELTTTGNWAAVFGHGWAEAYRGSTHLHNLLVARIGPLTGLDVTDAMRDLYILRSPYQRANIARPWNLFMQQYTFPKITNHFYRVLNAPGSKPIDPRVLVYWFQSNAPVEWKRDHYKAIQDQVATMQGAGRHPEEIDTYLTQHGIARRQEVTAADVVAVEEAGFEAMRVLLQKAKLPHERIEERLQRDPKHPLVQNLKALIAQDAPREQIEEAVRAVGRQLQEGQSPENAIEEHRRQDFVAAILYEQDDLEEPTGNISEEAVAYLLQGNGITE